MAAETDSKRAKTAAEAAAPPTVLGMREWIAEHRGSFTPPVCNKLMFGAGQLKIMFVGGPNQRADYHIEEGEELFYQVQGDMLLKIMERGQPRDIPIREGEIFVLPGRIPHSPQRFENTVGLVIERERAEHEIDGLRYYQPSAPTEPLWERWFHCVDLGAQLKPVIEEFFASEAHKTGKPQPGDVADQPKVKIDTENSAGNPVNLSQWLDDNKEKIAAEPVLLFSAGEFQVEAAATAVTRQPHAGHQLFVWQVRGESDVQIEGGESRSLRIDDVMLIEPQQTLHVTPKDGGVALLMQMVVKKSGLAA